MTKEQQMHAAQQEEERRGSEHYLNSGEYEHWDFVHEFGLCYFLGNATKYVARMYRRDVKFLQDDTNKALHYLDKFEKIRQVPREELGDIAMIRDCRPLGTLIEKAAMITGGHNAFTNIIVLIAVWDFHGARRLLKQIGK